MGVTTRETDAGDKSEGAIHTSERCIFAVNVFGTMPWAAAACDVIDGWKRPRVWIRAPSYIHSNSCCPKYNVVYWKFSVLHFVSEDS